MRRRSMNQRISARPNWPTSTVARQNRYSLEMATATARKNANGRTNVPGWPEAFIMLPAGSEMCKRLHLRPVALFCALQPAVLLVVASSGARWFLGQHVAVPNPCRQRAVGQRGPPLTLPVGQL